MSAAWTDFGGLFVSSISHAHGFFVGFDVNVTGARVERVHQDQVDEPDDGAFFGAGLERGDVIVCLALFNNLDAFGGAAVVADQLIEEIGALFTHAVVLFDGVIEFGHHRHDGFDVVAGEHAQIVQRHDVERVGHGKRQHVSSNGYRQHLILARKRLGHFVEDMLGDVVLGDANVRDSQLLAQGDDKVFLAEVFLFDKDVGKALAGGPLNVNAFAELLLGDQLLLEKHVPQPLFTNLRRHPVKPSRRLILHALPGTVAPRDTGLHLR